MIPVVNGCLRDPVSDKYWSYEERLLPYQKGLKARSFSGVAEGDVDLRPFTSPRQDQRSTSTCVAQATVKAMELKRIMALGREAHIDLSVLANYYLARELMFPQRTGSDSGTCASLACDAARRYGVCPDTDWPWEPVSTVLSRINQNPGWKAMRSAYLHKISAFYRINSTGQDRVEAVHQALLHKNPVIFGTVVGEDWFGYRTGTLGKETRPKGTHCTVLEGWKQGLFIGENSWGTGFGDDGFYYMDPSVIASDDSFDFWVVTLGWE